LRENVMSEAGGHRRRDLAQRAVVRASAGDTSGLHFLYARYADQVRDHVEEVAPEHGDPEAVTRQLFADLAALLVKYEPRTPFPTWLMRAARNAATAQTADRR